MSRTSVFARPMAAHLELDNCLPPHKRALRFISARSTTLSFVQNALSLSHENATEESYLTHSKSFEDKQNRGVDDSTDQDQHRDAQKSGDVPY